MGTSEASVHQPAALVLAVLAKQASALRLETAPGSLSLPQCSLQTDSEAVTGNQIKEKQAAEATAAEAHGQLRIDQMIRRQSIHSRQVTRFHESLEVSRGHTDLNHRRAGGALAKHLEPLSHMPVSCR